MNLTLALLALIEDDERGREREKAEDGNDLDSSRFD
jgi:hypothetical protein